MYEELSKNHEVHVYTPRKNTLFPWIPPFDGGAYDLALMNHGVTVNRLKSADIKKRVMTSHGVIPGAEKPVDGADVYVAVSEEVQKRLGASGYASHVIRNPINLDWFKTRTPIPQELTSVMFLSNNPRNLMSTNLRKAVDMAGIKLVEAGGTNKTIGMREAFQDVGMVFGLGRSAYEGMAMERNVVIFDYNGADGVATPETLELYRTSNCSGRFHREQWDEYEIVEAFESYDPDRGPLLREYIRENNNVVTIAEKYLCL